MPSGERAFDFPGVAGRGPVQARPAGPTGPRVAGRGEVRAGETTKFRVRVAREGGSRPVTLRFEGTPRGISVGGLAIPANAQEAEVVVSATSDAPPSVANVGVSAEVGDRRAEARVRLSVLPSAASEAYSRGRELLRGARGQGDRGVQRGDQARSWARLGVLLPGHHRPHRRASARCAGRLHQGDPAQAGHRHRLRGPGPDSLRDGGPLRALADYDEAIRLKPNNAITLGARGRIYADLGQYDRALADYSEVIRLKPESAEAHYLRGKTRYISGDNAGAVVDFTEAIKLDPTHAWAYRHRGDAFARLGNRARADADRAMVDRLARPSARPVKFRENLRCQLLPRRSPGRATGAVPSRAARASASPPSALRPGRPSVTRGDEAGRGGSWWALPRV